MLILISVSHFFDGIQSVLSGFCYLLSLHFFSFTIKFILVCIFHLEDRMISDYLNIQFGIIRNFLKTSSLLPRLATWRKVSQLILSLKEWPQKTIAGTIRGSGRQKIGAIANLAAYYLMGFPTAILLAFSYHIGGKVKSHFIYLFTYLFFWSVM